MKDLFDENNKFYKESKDNPLEISLPLGLSLF